MPVVTLTRARLAYGHQPLLDDADFQLDARERVGLIGRNGTGKSSLLKVLAGQRRPRRRRALGRAAGPRRVRAAGARRSTPASTVYDAVALGLAQRGPAAGRLSPRDRARWPSDADDAHALARVDALHARARRERRLGARPPHRHRAVAPGAARRRAGRRRCPAAGRSAWRWRRRWPPSRTCCCSTSRPTISTSPPSSGWRRCCRASPAPCSSSPTTGAFSTPSPPASSSSTAAGCASYPGSFAAYQERKARELADEAVADAKFDKVLAQEEVWIRKGVEARRTRNEGRVRRLEQLRRERAARRERLGQVRLQRRRRRALRQAGGRARRRDARPSAGRTLIRDFTTRILRGDRIGLIGPNGAGKTTLLKLILGELAPDAGTVRRGTKLAVAYFDQLRAQLDDDATLRTPSARARTSSRSAASAGTSISYLGDFLFPPERARSPVRSLSGGERNRLLLARLFARPANVLVLDEPTNDLDIETLELLEELLQDYARHALPGEPRPRLPRQRGDADDRLRRRRHAARVRRRLQRLGRRTRRRGCRARGRGAAGGPPRAPPRRRRPPAARGRECGAAAPRRALTFNEEQRARRAAGADRGARSAQSPHCAQRFADPALYRDAPADVRALGVEQEAIEDELAAAYARWEALETRSAGG